MLAPIDIVNDYQRGCTTALLLGSGELGKEVAIELMRYGIRDVACDRYDNAPAMAVANDKAVLNMRDPEALRNLIHTVKPDLVIPEIEAIATQVLVELEESEGLRVVPSARAAATTMNRETIRRLAAEDLGLPTSPYFFASSAAEVHQNIAKVGFPCFMKPVMSSSGKGQSLIKDESEIIRAFETACDEGRGGMTRVIVEGMVKFDREITLLTVSACDGIHFCRPVGHHQEHGDYRESWQPEPLEDDVMISCRRIASEVVEALGGYGIFGVELFICGHSVLFSEVSPRPHDTGMVTMISQDLSEFALHARAVLGLPIPKVNFFGPSASKAIVVEGDTTMVEFENLEEVLAEPDVQIRIFGKPFIKGHRRMGVLLARAETVEAALEKVERAYAKLKVKVL